MHIQIVKNSYVVSNKNKDCYPKSINSDVYFVNGFLLYSYACGLHIGILV